MSNEHVDAAFREILAGVCPPAADGKLAAILRAYDKALLDPQTKIPTALMCAIEAARC